VTIPYKSKTNNTVRREIRFFFSADALRDVSDPQRFNGFLAPDSPGAVTEDHVNIVPADGEQFPPDIAINYYLRREGVDIYLNDSYFWETDTNEYEFEIKRSEMVPDSLMDIANLMLHTNGNTYDFFDARKVDDKWSTLTEVGQFADTIQLELSASVVKRPPIPSDAKIATLQIRVKNFDLSDLSVKASGLVPESPGFTTYGASSNPADVFRYLMTGPLSVDAVDPAELDSGMIADWRDECIDKGYEANGLLKDSIGDAIDLVCAAGHARYNEGFKYGIIYDRDTTSEPALQHFTPINTRGLSWSKAYTKKPNTFRVEFYNKDRNHELDEIEVVNPQAPGNDPEDSEVVRYPLIDSEDQIRARAYLDFEQLNNSLRYSFNIGLESLAVSRGQIALLSSQFIHRSTGWARVLEIVDATTLRLDRPDLNIGVYSNFHDVTNVFDVVDVMSEGVASGLSVRLSASSGTQISEVIAYNDTTKEITIDNTADIRVGDLCTVGPLGQSTKRVIVTSIVPKDAYEAEVTCMEEV